MKVKLSKTQQREFKAILATMAERRAKRKAAQAPCKICGTAGAGPICTVCARG